MLKVSRGHGTIVVWLNWAQKKHKIMFLWQKLQFEKTWKVGGGGFFLKRRRWLCWIYSSISITALSNRCPIVKIPLPPPGIESSIWTGLREINVTLYGSQGGQCSWVAFFFPCQACWEVQIIMLLSTSVLIFLGSIGQRIDLIVSYLG